MRNVTIRPPALAKRLAAKRLVAAGVTLGIVAATSGAALAASPFTVKLTVPKNVSSSTLVVKASGVAASPSQAVAYIGDNGCASTAKLEAAQHVRRVLNKTVNHTYTASKSAQAGSAGTHRVCAYLTSTNGSTTRARASALYNVLAGAY